MEIERDDSLCKYNGGSCPNKRAIRSLKHGLLRFCEYHQRRANTYQKKYLQRHKKPRCPPLTVEAGSPVPPAVAAAAVPFIVFVVARETNIAGSLPRFTSAAGLVNNDQPLSAVALESSDQLVELLRRVGGGETISAVVGSQPALVMSAAAPVPDVHSETIHTDGLNPLSVLPSTDTESSLSQEDADWLSELFG